MKIINFIKRLFNNNNNTVSGSAIHAMTIDADIISVNTIYGHYEIGNNIGFTGEINGAKFIGGICVGKVDK